MRNYGQYSTMLSLGQIRQMLATPGVVNTESLQRFAIARFTTVIINMLALTMSLPFFLVRGPTNLLRASLFCAGTAIPAMMGALIAVAMDLPGIPPVVEVFLPVVVLVPMAMFMTTTIRT